MNNSKKTDPSNQLGSTGTTEESSIRGFQGEDLVIDYGGDPIIDGESLEVPPESITALIGPNGSGKSTLLKGLAKQHTPTSGTVYLNGRDVYELGTKELAQKLGLLSQENVLPESITVKELVQHGRYPHRGFFEPINDDDRIAINQAIEFAGITDLREREVGSLSGGQKQLAWIAMILAQETDVLLLDEPTTFLDLRHQLIVMEIIDKLNETSTTTVVLVLHDIQQACRHADYMIVLSEGEIYDRGTPVSVMTEAMLADVFGVNATVEIRGERAHIEPNHPL